MKFLSDYLPDAEIAKCLEGIGATVTVLDSDPPDWTIMVSPKQLGELLDWASDKAQPVRN